MAARISAMNILHRVPGRSCNRVHIHFWRNDIHLISAAEDSSHSPSYAVSGGTWRRRGRSPRATVNKGRDLHETDQRAIGGRQCFGRGPDHHPGVGVSEPAASAVETLEELGQSGHSASLLMEGAVAGRALTVAFSQAACFSAIMMG